MQFGGYRKPMPFYGKRFVKKLRGRQRLFTDALLC
jgi:hypothetical protein